MKKRKVAQKKVKRSRISNGKLLFLSIILLFIVVEALFILKGTQQTFQANSLDRQVAGVSIEK